MKTIVGVSEFGTLTNVYKASLVAVMVGSDFIHLTSIDADGDADRPRVV